MDTTVVYQVQHMAPFGPLIVLYFFLAGLSAGLFIISSLSVVFGIEKFKAVAKPASVLALATLIPGLLALVIDLGQPLRALTLFIRVNPSSVMSWGSYILLIYGIVCTVYTWLLWKDNLKAKFWGKIGVVFAAALGLYTGFLLSVVPGHPLWNSALLPILFLLSGGVAGLSLLSLAQSFFPKATMLDGSGAEDALHDMKKWMVILELFLVAFHLFAVFTVNVAGKVVVSNLLGGTKQISFVVIQIGVGLLLTLAILLFSKRSTLSLGLAGLTSIIGVFALRYNFVMGGEEIPSSGSIMYGFESGNAWVLTGVLLVVTVALVLVLPKIVSNVSGGNNTNTYEVNYKG